jgi:SAM-dependent methyltransferase
MGKIYDYVGSELDLFARAKRWKSYVCSQLQHFIRGDVLEVGSGIGETTKALCVGKEKSWTCLEPDQNLAIRLTSSINEAWFSERFSPYVIIGSISEFQYDMSYDTVLFIDVIEHIEKDALELEASSRLLRPEGYLIVLAPAYQWLFSPYDAAIGHFRRYNKKTLIRITPPGTVIEKLWYLDSVGLLASLGNRLILRSGMPNLKQLRLWDRLMVPCSRVLDPLFGYRVGKTIIGVWRRSNSL